MPTFPAAITWEIIAIFLLSLAAVGVVLVYYPFSTTIWKHRFRIVRGVDHIGPILEMGFVLIVAGVTVLLARVIYPTAGATILAEMQAFPRSSLSIALAIGLGLMLLVNTFICFINSPKEILEEFPGQFPAVHEELVRAGKWKGQQARLRIGYVPYFLYGIASWGAFFFVMLLIGYGFVTDVQHLSGLATDLDEAPRLEVGPGLMTGAQTLLVEFSSYQENLLSVAIRVLGASALVLLILMWFLGTNFQTLYTPTVVNMCRVAAVVTLVATPLIVLAFYSWFYFWEREVSSRFMETALLLTQQGRGNPELLREFNQVHSVFLERVTQYNFWFRITTSWGGVLLALEYLFSLIQKRLGNYDLFANLLPDGRNPLHRVVRAFFRVEEVESKPIASRPPSTNSAS